MIIYFLDGNALQHALEAGLPSGWREGDPIPSNAFRYLDELVAGKGRFVFNSAS